VRYVFVDGNFYKIEVKDEKKDTKATAKGTWNYTSENPQDKSGKIDIKEDKGKYSGTITSAGGKDVELKDIVLKENSLTFSFEGTGGKQEVTVKIDSDSFDGTVKGSQGSFSIKAKRDPKSK